LLFFEPWYLFIAVRICLFEQSFDTLSGEIIKKFQENDGSDEDDQSCNGEMNIHISLDIALVIK